MIGPLALALLGADADLARVTAIQLPAGLALDEALMADVDGDRRADLVLTATAPGFERYVRVHLDRDGGTFAQEPDHELRLTKDVTAFAVGDVHADAGSELVLFTARGAFAWRPTAPEESRYVRLVEASFLWQLGEDDHVDPWQAGVRDLDGDGRQDLLLPEPNGWRVALQRRGPEGDADFERVFELRVPADERRPSERRTAVRTEDGPVLDAERQQRRRFEIHIGGGADVEDESYWTGPLVQVDERAPAPQLYDFDGDGDLDVIAQTAYSLLVWLQADAHAFGTEPDLRFALPVEVDLGRRLDISYSALLAQLDGDGRVDCVIFAGDKRSDDVRTQVLVFLQDGTRAESPLFGPKGLPAQLLVLAGFAGGARLADVDGDAAPDLIVGAVRPDLIDQITGAATDSLEIELTVFLNAGRGFSRRPDLTHRVRVPTDRMNASVRFLSDVTGDGVQELLAREEAERLTVQLVRAPDGRGGRLEVLDRPLWELRVHEDARLRFAERPEAYGRPDLLVLEEAQLLHVRFP